MKFAGIGYGWYGDAGWHARCIFFWDFFFFFSFLSILSGQHCIRIVCKLAVEAFWVEGASHGIDISMELGSSPSVLFARDTGTVELVLVNPSAIKTLD